MVGEPVSDCSIAYEGGYGQGCTQACGTDYTPCLLCIKHDHLAALQRERHIPVLARVHLHAHSAGMSCGPCSASDIAEHLDSG